LIGILKGPGAGLGAGDFFTGFLVDGHMDGFSCSYQGFSAFESVLKRKGSLADMADLNGYDNVVTHHDRGQIIRLSVHDGKEIAGAFEHGLETPTEFFQQIFISIMDDFKLIGKENNACGISIVQPDLCFVCKHVLIIPNH